MRKLKVIDFTDSTPRIYTNPNLTDFSVKILSGKAVVNPDLDAVRGVSPEYWGLIKGRVVAINKPIVTKSFTFHLLKYSSVILCIVLYTLLIVKIVNILK